MATVRHGHPVQVSDDRSEGSQGDRSLMTMHHGHHARVTMHRVAMRSGHAVSDRSHGPSYQRLLRTGCRLTPQFEEYVSVLLSG